MSGALFVLGAKDNPMGVLTSFGIVAAMAIVYALTRPKLLAPEAAPQLPELPGARVRSRPPHPDGKGQVD
jgi:hypothetical protein